ncbi:hypothetical protein [Microvirga sp. 2TAF3]|uniref:hypothetical protein n=1 Tax=Microvirga sp. 2TAF3 TaxID=3233014 RepID=UPI003F96454D
METIVSARQQSGGAKEGKRASGARPLLPFEPRIIDVEREQALTERFLLPAQGGLMALFLSIRRRLDPVLRVTQPVKLGKLYPIGQCMEIALALQTELRQLDSTTLAPAAAEGYAALSAFLAHGGSARLVWGDLRGEYFQNAFLIGTLYVDGANDTVLATKPPVEILPYAEARFFPVGDYHHFARIASRYWNARIFPNHILPSLAPYFPVFTAIPGDSLRLEPSSYMSMLTVAEVFRPSETVLSEQPMDEGIFQALASCLAGFSLPLASDPVKGRAQAVKRCRQFRAEQRHRRKAPLAAAMEMAGEVNKLLRQLTVSASPAEGSSFGT